MEDKFVKLTRIHRKQAGLEEYDLYLNTKYIISFRAAERTEMGNARIDVSFPDTVRSYAVKETPEEINKQLVSFDYVNKVGDFFDTEGDEI